MPVEIEKIAWGGWPNCYRMSNGAVELVVTADIGPRIMRFGFVGGQNFFRVFEDQQGKSGEPDWQLRGGHRVWLAPEDRVLTYAPDNSPVQIEANGETLIATQPVEPSTGLQKQLVIRLDDIGTRVEVLHRIRNTLPFAIEISAWTVTMMARSGVAVTGFPPRASHADVLAPSNPLVMWAFTNLKDPRWEFFEKYLLLRHDPANRDHTKLGHFNSDTWGAYFLGSEAFLKWCAACPALTYPDFGCSCELFASDEMLEIETLSPLTKLGPGLWLEHREYWSLHQVLNTTNWNEETLDCILIPLLKSRGLHV
jgi:hypothetical protein